MSAVDGELEKPITRRSKFASQLKDSLLWAKANPIPVLLGVMIIMQGATWWSINDFHHYYAYNLCGDSTIPCRVEIQNSRY